MAMHMSNCCDICISHHVPYTRFVQREEDRVTGSLRLNFLSANDTTFLMTKHAIANLHPPLVVATVAAIRAKAAAKSSREDTSGAPRQETSRAR